VAEMHICLPEVDLSRRQVDRVYSMSVSRLTTI